MVLSRSMVIIMFRPQLDGGLEGAPLDSCRITRVGKAAGGAPG